MTTHASDTHVSLRLRLRPRDYLPNGECLWATPLDADDGGGTYQLANTSCFTAMAAGDLVRAEPDAIGRLQIVDVVEPSGGILTVVRLDETCLGLAQEAGDAWIAHGAIWSSGGLGMMQTIWEPEVGWNEIERAVAPYVARGLTWLGGVQPEQRRRSCHPDVDFELDLRPVNTSYRAVDDPFWKVHGLDDPETLEDIQGMATTYHEISSAIEAGNHQWVVDQLGLRPRH